MHIAYENFDMHSIYIVVFYILWCIFSMCTSWCANYMYKIYVDVHNHILTCILCTWTCILSTYVHYIFFDLLCIRICILQYAVYMHMYLIYIPYASAYCVCTHNTFHTQVYTVYAYTSANCAQYTRAMALCMHTQYTLAYGMMHIPYASVYCVCIL